MARIVGLDFETETSIHNQCTPLLVALYAENYERTFELQKREQYVEFLQTIILSGDKYVVYNASFDVEIIIIMLLKNGFSFLKNNEEPQHKTMKLLMGQKIYSLSTYYKVKGRMIETQYVDLGNIIVGSNLADIAKKFTPYEKGDFETSKENMEEFKKYCLLDAKITREAYITMTKLLGKQYVTIGSAAFNIMLEMSFKAKTKKGRMQLFKRLFGETTIEEDKYNRKWYAGGFGWGSTDVRTETTIDSWDIISAYPAESVGTLPTLKDHQTYESYKAPTKEYPFAFIRMKVTGQIKKNHAPILPSRNIYGDSNIYIYDDKEVCIIQEYGRKSEYDYFMENIELETPIEYLETRLLKNAQYNPFIPFMTKYYDMKEHSVGVERELAKRLINSLTGKLGTNPVKENISYTLDHLNKMVKDGSEPVEIETYATHVVSVITSRVRCKLYNVDEKLRDKAPFRLYATDSVKHTTLDTPLIQQGTTWGEWDLEHKETDFIFLGLKAYIYDPHNRENKRKVVCAGISGKYRNLITNEQFYAANMVKSLVSMRKGNGRIIYEGLKRIVNPVKKPRRREEIEQQRDKYKELRDRFETSISEILVSSKGRPVGKSIQVSNK